MKFGGFQNGEYCFKEEEKNQNLSTLTFGEQVHDEITKSA
jgi:hypothetical protein